MIIGFINAEQLMLAIKTYNQTGYYYKLKFILCSPYCNLIEEEKNNLPPYNQFEIGCLGTTVEKESVHRNALHFDQQKGLTHSGL